jgi:hypothetical protein
MRIRVLVFCALLLPACAPARRPPPVPPPTPALVLRLPPRPANALTGTRFLQAIQHANEMERERAIQQAIEGGNIPDFLRSFVRVEYHAETRRGQTRAVTLWVMPDYLAVGDDRDAVRMPMSPITAQQIADRFGLLLPTAKIVDRIYRAAAVKLGPRPFPPSAWMVRTEEFVHHDRVIDAQLDYHTPPGLVAGHKKDIVLSNKLEARPHRVAIYGWHRLDGRPIQPLSTAHGDWYCDYSHGVRLIAPTMLIDGKEHRVADVLRDPELAPLLSDEGPLLHTRYRTENGIGRASWWPALP